MKYSITEVAKIIAKAPSTIRYYEQEGLLPNIQRSQNGRRYFIDDDIKRLNIINCLKKTGMSLKNIQNCLSKCDDKINSINERLELFVSHRQNIFNEIKALEECLIQVDEKIITLQNKKLQIVNKYPNNTNSIL